ncbi:hypothetical protein [Nocardia terpenica]|uniref:Malonyl-CoA:ACP transacylase (MAT) domain-containing protein n=1 Tax=Nocardia terpenica TaxID=455432 RepID=A0A164P004_9NOCA|nr:hypothetical protein [Nocardia terpenica]KZM74936.1 hypothetical protein AWN90_23270 [Nocardia terpenica]NQE93401.1 hypothetical protein [Nocardia terpenica]
MSAPPDAAATAIGQALADGGHDGSAVAMITVGSQVPAGADKSAAGVAPALAIARFMLGDKDVRSVVITAVDCIGAVALLVSGGQATIGRRIYATVDAAPTVDDASNAVEIDLPTTTLGLADGTLFLLGVVRAALCLHHCYLPPADERARPRPWVRTSPRIPNRALLSGRDADGTHARVLLSGATLRGEVTAVDWSRSAGPLLLPVAGRTMEDLLARISALRAASDPWAASPSTGPLRAVFCGRDIDQIRQELSTALTSLPVAHRAGRDWRTPSGSFCTSRPVGRDGRVALVFPGVFSPYAGLGRDMLRPYPGLLLLAEAAGIVPRYLDRADRLHGRAATDQALLADFAALVTSGVGFSFLQTRILRDLHRLPVHGALGYSLGELSMIYAPGWRTGTEDDWVARDPALFASDLGGPKRVVRARWGIPAQVPDGQVWGSWVVFADAAMMAEQVARHRRVFLTHINSPHEVVIAGDPAQCRSVLAAVAAPGLPAAASYVLHCPLPDPARLARFVSPVVGQLPDLELFSACGYDRVQDLAPDRLTTAMATMLRRMIDFPRLVGAAYRHGYRYFIEVGPGANCTRWIDAILGDAPHVAVSVDRRGSDTVGGIARMLATMAGHGLPVDLSMTTNHPSLEEKPCVPTASRMS